MHADRAPHDKAADCEAHQKGVVADIAQLHDAVGNTSDLWLALLAGVLQALHDKAAQVRLVV